MRLRTAALGIGCSLAILIAGCSSPTIPGSPQAAGGGAPVSTGAGASSTGGVGGSGGDTGGSGSATVSTGASSGSGGGTGSSGSGSSGSGGGSGSGTAGPGDGATSIPGIPTDLSDLTSIPGLNGDCLAVASAMIAIGLLIAAPALGGQPLTKDQVDQAFQGLDSAPAEIQPAIKTLHDAATQAIGKSQAEALTILGSQSVSAAMDTLSKYSDKQCGNS